MLGSRRMLGVQLAQLSVLPNDPGCARLAAKAAQELKVGMLCNGAFQQRAAAAANLARAVPAPPIGSPCSPETCDGGSSPQKAFASGNCKTDWGVTREHEAGT